MRALGTPAIALLFLVACHQDGLDSTAASPLHCVSEGAVPAPLSLAPFQAITVSSDRLSNCVTLPANGSTYLVVGEFASVGDPTVAVNWQIGTAGLPDPSLTSSQLVRAPNDNPAQRAFEGTLRAIEARIAPRLRAQVTAIDRRASIAKAVNSQPPAIGSTRTFNVVAALDGSSFTTATARLLYAGEHILLYVDTIGSGFTEAEYQAYGALFDKDLYGIDTKAFGSESDIDQNGRVIALFTPRVNELVDRGHCAFAGYVTGFFYGTDLLTSDPHSNKGEIFYSYIPDPSGTFSCSHEVISVAQAVPGSFLHELQHMISFNQHVLVRRGAQEEEWLNEGLGQIAEELGSEYYEAKYPPPTGRSTTTQIFPDSAGPFIQPQLLDAYIYLGTTRAHSVTSYVGGGSLEERGATWLFLRWLAAQKGEDIFGRLVRTSHTGIANIQAEAGEPFDALFGDFSTALWVDSIPGEPRSSVPARFQFGGARNLRKLMAREATIETFPNPWPLALAQMGVGGTLSASMIPGTMVHASITPPAGGANVSLTFTGPQSVPFPAALGAQLTIFRMPP